MNRKNVLLLTCTLGATTCVCAQSTEKPLLNNRQDSIYYAKSYFFLDDKKNAKEYSDLVKYSDVFITAVSATYNGFKKGLSEKEIKEEIRKNNPNLEHKETVETGLMLGALCFSEGERGAIFIQSLIDKLKGESSLGWKEEDMANYLKRIETASENKKASKGLRWDKLISESGYKELKTKSEGIASELDYEGRGVLMKTTNEGKGERAKLKDTVTLEYYLKLADGTEVGYGKAVEVTPDYVINGLCAALINMKEGGEASIIIPEGLGYRDDVIFDDPLKTDRKKVENKEITMDIKVLKIKRKY
ncbi:MAG: FKBP-type peptidyl-prolyl cis-trans isomerase [Paludibacteraceae bacterium]|nr:FKBP-type peptidyl-prolyl cis-trans isomerase [Paludibacteraceae bacterium]